MANIADSAHQSSRAIALLDKLKAQLKGFAVFDKNKALVGEVRDLTLHPQNRFNLIISQPDPHKGNRLFSVNSKWVQRVHSAENAVYLTMTEDDITHLPDYPMSPTFNSPDAFDSPIDSTRSSNINPGVNEMQMGSERPIAIPATPNTVADPQAIVEQSALVSHETTAFSPSDETVIRLVEEKLQVNRDKRKVGEVIVRKEIETTMVQVPIRREKLIVEQISPERRELARVDLKDGAIEGLALTEQGISSDGKPVVRGEFSSPRAASQMLAEMAKILHHRCASVRVELVLQDPQLQETYQSWITHYGGELR